MKQRCIVETKINNMCESVGAGFKPAPTKHFKNVWNRHCRHITIMGNHQKKIVFLIDQTMIVPL